MKYMTLRCSDVVQEEHLSLARVGYATKPLSCAWITKNIICYSISTGFVKQRYTCQEENKIIIAFRYKK